MTKLNEEIFEKIYKDKDVIIKNNAVDLASELNVSRSQITKFSQRLGYSGYRELRTRIIKGSSVFHLLEMINKQVTKSDNHIGKLDIRKDDFYNFMNNVYKEYYLIFEELQWEKCTALEMIEVFVLNILELITVGNKNNLSYAEKNQLITCVSSNISCIKYQLENLT